MKSGNGATTKCVRLERNDNKIMFIWFGLVMLRYCYRVRYVDLLTSVTTLPPNPRALSLSVHR